jgi:hypothetical protein
MWYVKSNQLLYTPNVGERYYKLSHKISERSLYLVLERITTGPADCDGRNCRCDVSAGSYVEVWRRLVSGHLSVVTTCTKRVLMVYHVRFMWESSLKVCQDIPGENVLARNLMRNFTKRFNNKFSLWQLQCSTICIPVALIYMDQLSYWAIPVDVSLHAFSVVPVQDCTLPVCPQRVRSTLQCVLYHKEQIPAVTLN